MNDIKAGIISSPRVEQLSNGCLGPKCNKNNDLQEPFQLFYPSPHRTEKLKGGRKKVLYIYTTKCINKTYKDTYQHFFPFRSDLNKGPEKSWNSFKKGPKLLFLNDLYYSLTVPPQRKSFPKFNKNNTLTKRRVF